MKWFYPMNGSGDPLYQQGKYIYGQNGACLYHEGANGWWYSMNGGQGEFYLRGKYVYATNGGNAVYFTNS